jgi:transglutaminase-like putative cysteine protease
MRGRVVGSIVNGCLVAGIVLAPAAAVATANLDPTLPFGSVAVLALLGAILGLVLAASRISGPAAHGLALCLGPGAILSFVTSVEPGVPADASWSDRVFALGSDLVSWVQVVASGGQAVDNLVFLLLTAAAAWLMGYVGAWSVFRDRAAGWPVAVGMTAMAMILATFPKYYGFLLFELVASLLLIGHMNFQSRQVSWEAAGVSQSRSVRPRALRAGAALILALVALAWLAPTALARQPISRQLGGANQPWQQTQQEFHRMFGGLQAPPDGNLSGFSRAITLGGSFHQSDQPVMTVAASQPAYWRVTVFDQYTGQGWASADPIEQGTLQPGSAVLRPSDQGRADLTQQFTILSPRTNFLAGAGQPYGFDQAVTTQIFPVAPGDDVDLVATLADTPLGPSSQYTVTSGVSTASPDELRAADANYPPEVRQRYLELPTMPDRVVQLARQLTAGQPNPYDKALAVEMYLRSFPYTLDLSPPPADHDAVDYFLFDARTGYCDYFASAMVVLLRSVGIPARVAAGYATGTLQDSGDYLVKDSDAHSWVEAYFPPYGWIPFEPSAPWPGLTPSGAPEDPAASPPAVPTPSAGAAGQSDQSTTSQSDAGGGQSSDATPTPTPNPDDPTQSAANPTDAPLDPRSLLWLLSLLGAIAMLAGLLWWVWERDLRGRPPVVVAYVKMIRLASFLGFRHCPADTPDEYGHALSGAVPRAGPSVQRIAGDYARYQFSRRDTSAGDRPLQQWRLVRNALLRQIGRLHR